MFIADGLKNRDEAVMKYYPLADFNYRQCLIAIKSKIIQIKNKKEFKKNMKIIWRIKK